MYDDPCRVQCPLGAATGSPTMTKYKHDKICLLFKIDFVHNLTDLNSCVFILCESPHVILLLQLNTALTVVLSKQVFYLSMV